MNVSACVMTSVFSGMSEASNVLINFFDDDDDDEKDDDTLRIDILAMIMMILKLVSFSSMMIWF